MLLFVGCSVSCLEAFAQVSDCSGVALSQGARNVLAHVHCLASRKVQLHVSCRQSQNITAHIYLALGAELACLD